MSDIRTTDQTAIHNNGHEYLMTRYSIPSAAFVADLRSFRERSATTRGPRSSTQRPRPELLRASRALRREARATARRSRSHHIGSLPRVLPSRARSIFGACASAPRSAEPALEHDARDRPSGASPSVSRSTSGGSRDSTTFRSTPTSCWPPVEVGRPTRPHGRPRGIEVASLGGSIPGNLSSARRSPSLETEFLILSSSTFDAAGIEELVRSPRLVHSASSTSKRVTSHRALGPEARATGHARSRHRRSIQDPAARLSRCCSCARNDVQLGTSCASSRSTRN
jgi:hypothetical protein